MNIDIVQALGPIRRAESDVNTALLNARQTPLDINAQVAFHNALVKKGLTISTITNLVGHIHSSRRNIINSF